MAKAAPVLKSSLLERFVPVLLLISFVLSFVVGVLWQKVNDLEKGPRTTTTTTTGQQANVDIETIKGLWDKNVIKFGDKSKKLLVVEVADPSCPFCHVAGGFDPEIAAQMDTKTNRFKYVSAGGQYLPPVPEIKKLVDEGKAGYVYLYFPGHGSGEMAAKALYCAYDQGKFWQAHDLLMSEKGYEIQNGVTATGTESKGVVVGNDKSKSGALADFLKGVVDAKALKDCLDSGKYDSRLATEQDISANELGATGTPGFFLNTTRFDGAYSWEDMKSAVDAALK